MSYGTREWVSEGFDFTPTSMAEYKDAWSVANNHPSSRALKARNRRRAKNRIERKSRRINRKKAA